MPDVLGHADRGHRVERLAAEVAVVLQPDLDAVGEPGVGHPLAGEGGLRLADRDADDGHVVVRRGVDRHGAPAAPDVEEPSAGEAVETELAADEVVLGGLGVREVGVGVHEPGARVRHRRAEHEAVEVVAHVVVVADGLGVASHRVAPAVQAGLLRRRRQRPAEHTQAPRRSHRWRHEPQHIVALLGQAAAHGGDELEDVAVGVELPGDVRPAQPELVRAPQQPADGIR